MQQVIVKKPIGLMKQSFKGHKLPVVNQDWQRRQFECAVAERLTCWFDWTEVEIVNTQSTQVNDTKASIM